MEDNKKEQIVSMAACCVHYSEVLNIDATKQAQTLGFILRVYSKEIMDLSAFELSLLVSFLTRIREEYYEKYIQLFNKEILTYVISSFSDIKLQIQCLEKVEDLYYDFCLDQQTISFPFISLLGK